MRKTWFTFAVDLFTPHPMGGKGRRTCLVLTVLTRTMEIGYQRIEGRIPPGHRVWTWWAGSAHKLSDAPNFCCNLCGAPWHPASGHIDIRKGRMWCGPCTASMIKFLKSMLARRWGKVRFYDHALVPPPSPPAGWEA